MYRFYCAITALCFAILGLGVALLFRPPILFLLVVAVGCLILSAISHNTPLIAASFLCCAVFSIGMLYTIGWRTVYRVEFRTGPSTFTATVISRPAPQTRGIRFIVQTLDKIGKNWQDQAVNGNIQITADAFPLPHIGDQLRITGILTPPPIIAGFNYPLVLERSGVFASIQQPHLQIIGHTNSFFFKMQSWVDEKEQAIRQALPEPESSFLTSMLFGDSSGLQNSLKQAVQETGVSRLITLSGTTVILFFAAFEQIFVLPQPLFRLALLTVVILLLYCISGAAAGVIRGGLFVLSRALLRLTGRRILPIPFLLLLYLALLLINPLESGNAGFYLSIAAYAGILCLAPLLEKLFRRWKLPATVASALAASAAITFTTLPLSLWAFGEAPLLGIITSPLAYLLLPILLFLGYTYVFCISTPILGKALLLPLWLLLHTIVRTVTALNQIPVAIHV